MINTPASTTSPESVSTYTRVVPSFQQILNSKFQVQKGRETYIGCTINTLLNEFKKFFLKKNSSRNLSAFFFQVANTYIYTLPLALFVPAS